MSDEVVIGGYLIIAIIVTILYEVALIRSKYKNLPYGDGLIVGICWPLVIVVVIPILGLFYLGDLYKKTVDGLPHKNKS